MKKEVQETFISMLKEYFKISSSTEYGIKKSNEIYEYFNKDNSDIGSLYFKVLGYGNFSGSIGKLIEIRKLNSYKGINYRLEYSNNINKVHDYIEFYSDDQSTTPILIDKRIKAEVEGKLVDISGQQLEAGQTIIFPIDNRLQYGKISRIKKTGAIYIKHPTKRRVWNKTSGVWGYTSVVEEKESRVSLINSRTKFPVLVITNQLVDKVFLKILSAKDMGELYIDYSIDE